MASTVGPCTLPTNLYPFSNSKVDEYQHVHEEAAADIVAYLSNPINAFRLTKRLTTDWREVETLMLDDVGSSECQSHCFNILSQSKNNLMMVIEVGVGIDKYLRHYC